MRLPLIGDESALVEDMVDVNAQGLASLISIGLGLGGGEGGPYEPADAAIQTHIQSAHAPANAQANADITKPEIEAKLTGVITSHTHAEPWTYVYLTQDFNTTSATAVDITGLAFAPAINTRYEVEVRLGLRTNTATVNPRPGWAWATNLADGWGKIHMAQSATADLIANGNIAAALLMAVGGLPNTTQTWPCFFTMTVVAGASTSGTCRVQLASETNGTQVTAKTGSWLRYRPY